MKLVIDIPDSYYSACKDWKTNCVATVEQCIIADGIPYEERPKGKWIYDGIYHDNDNPIDSDMYHCSLCKRSITTTLTNPTELLPYCNCGADMRSVDEGLHERAVSDLSKTVDGLYKKLRGDV